MTPADDRVVVSVSLDTATRALEHLSREAFGFTDGGLAVLEVIKALDAGVDAAKARLATTEVDGR